MIDLVEAGVCLSLARDALLEQRPPGERKFVIADQVMLTCDLGFVCLTSRRYDAPIAYAFAAMQAVWDLKPLNARCRRGQARDAGNPTCLPASYNLLSQIDFSARHSSDVSSGGRLAGRGHPRQPVLGQRMAGDDRQALVVFLAGHPETLLRGWFAGRPSRCITSIAETVGVVLGLARMRRRHQRARNRRSTRGAADILNKKSDQERRRAIVDHAAHVVAMREMAEFVGQHPRDLVGILGLRKPVEQVGLAASTRRHWNSARQHAGLDRRIEAGGIRGSR